MLSQPTRSRRAGGFTQDHIAGGARTTGLDRRIQAIRATVAVKLVLLFVLAWNSRFVMDEFWQIGQSQYLFNGYFDTIWPSKAVGYAVFYQLAHWIGWDSVSTVLIGRMQTAVLGCGTIAIVYACARSMGQDKMRALLVMLVMLSFSNFEERIFRTRSEPLALFFGAAALLIVLRGNLARHRTVLLAGLASGLAFLTTQKGIYFNLALGLGLVIDAAVTRQYLAVLWRGSLLVAGWVIALLAYGLVFGGLAAPRVLHDLFFAPVELAVHGAEPYGGLRHFVTQTLSRNAILYFACCAGMVVAMLRLFRLSPAQRIGLGFTLVVSGLVFAHNQPWPYVFIMAIPFMALWVPIAMDSLPYGDRYRRAAWLVLIAAVGLGIVSNVAYLRFDNRGQLDVMTRAEEMLGPGDQYYDGTGMLPARRQANAMWLDRATILRTLAQGKESRAYGILANDPPKLIIWNYRMDAIEPVIGAIVREQYVRVSPNIWLLGRRLEADRVEKFVAEKAGRYAQFGEDGKRQSGNIMIDGRPAGSTFILSAGPHEIFRKGGREHAFILQDSQYAGLFSVAPDDQTLFTDVYE